MLILFQVKMEGAPPSRGGFRGRGGGPMRGRGSFGDRGR